MKGQPEAIVFTPNSDTPYEGANIDLTNGPMVVELPPGPLMCVVNDMNQRYVMDMGLPGPMPAKAASTSFFLQATKARSDPATSPERPPPTAFSSCLSRHPSRWRRRGRLACSRRSRCTP